MEAQKAASNVNTAEYTKHVYCTIFMKYMNRNFIVNTAPPLLYHTTLHTNFWKHDAYFFFMKLSFISHSVSVLQTGASILLAVSGRTNRVSQNPVNLSESVRCPCILQW